MGLALADFDRLVETGVIRSFAIGPGARLYEVERAR
jgi:hypothetical protein